VEGGRLRLARAGETAGPGARDGAETPLEG